MNGAGVSPAGGTDAGAVENNNINNELWQACAGPLVQLPSAGTHVVYFLQGHSEQVAASMRRNVDGQVVPSYPKLPSKILCLLHSVTLHADPETDEAYARMTLQPVPSFDKEAILRSELAMKAHKPHAEFFCKTLTASDTSTHGGFSVPRRAAEKIFPLLDHSVEPPSQELVARDLHENAWKFRHIYRGKPKRHLLTTGWSIFVGAKRLVAGDSVLFVRDEKQQLLLGIRRANRQLPNLSSSVLSSDSMHIGILAAAAHASANRSPFTVFYNPRASPSEFVVPLAKYFKAVCSSQISPGMRFRMMFETEDSTTRRYMGTITGIGDLDPIRWKGSQWRNLQVGWDESIPGQEKLTRVSIWEIEPATAPFFGCPDPSFFQAKRPRMAGIPDIDWSDMDSTAFVRRTMAWLGGSKDPRALPGLSLAQWMNVQPNVTSFGSTDSPADQFPEPFHAQQKLHPPSPLGSTVQPQLSEPRQNLQSQLQQSNVNGDCSSHQQIHSPFQEQILDLSSQCFSSSMLTGQIKVAPQETKAAAPAQFSLPPQHPNAGNFTARNFGGFQSTVTDDVPSCSNSPSANDCSTVIHDVMNRKARHLSSRSEVKPSLNVSKGCLLPRTCNTTTTTTTTTAATQADYHQCSLVPTMFQGNGLDSKLNGDLRNIRGDQLGIPPDDPFLTKNVDGLSGKDSYATFSDADVLLQTYESQKEAQPEPSTSMVSQSFGVPDIGLLNNSIDSSTLNDGGFVGRGTWAPPQIPRMRTYTKVYKRGAVGRSIDITRYLGYEELKQDLARRFGIEGQLEDGPRIGWKLVYVDHEGDVLLVGDDPWDEFVNCVRCIKILSPQEVQQMSLDGDFGNGRYAEPSS